jgi:hypothetical protein
VKEVLTVPVVTVPRRTEALRHDFQPRPSRFSCFQKANDVSPTLWSRAESVTLVLLPLDEERITRRFVGRSRSGGTDCLGDDRNLIFEIWTGDALPLVE